MSKLVDSDVVDQANNSSHCYQFDEGGFVRSENEEVEKWFNEDRNANEAHASEIIGAPIVLHALPGAARKSEE